MKKKIKEQESKWNSDTDECWQKTVYDNGDEELKQISKEEHYQYLAENKF